MAEKIQHFPVIVDLLNEHQIGYHSSSHSVHPTIFEFTDVEDYGRAYRISLQRETSHVNPLTGEIEGKGGLISLRELFHHKDIKAFRAPGHCWSPPHLEALRALGISFDFSTSLSPMPAEFKDITFHPYPAFGHWQGRLSEYQILLVSLLKRKYSVATFHPSLLANKCEWDLIFWSSNPKQLISPPPRTPNETRHLLRNFELLLKRIANFRKTHFIDVSPIPEKAHEKLVINEIDVKNCYCESMRWAIKQNYRPKFLRSHFFSFFKTTTRTLLANEYSNLRQNRVRLG